MKHAKKKPGSSVMVVLLIIIFVLAAFIGGICVGTKLLPKEDGAPQSTDQLDESTQLQETTNTVVVPSSVEQYTVYELSGEDIAVPTPYCMLYYPAQFEEFLRITHEFSAELYAVHFNADFGEGSTSNLFSVYFAKDDGKQPDGIIVGGLPDENGDITLVIVVTNSGLPHSDWSQDTANLVYAMQEGISECLENIRQLDDLVLDQ